MSALDIQIQATLGQFKIDTAVFTRQLNDAIMVDLVKRAVRVEAAAKVNATGAGLGPKVITGRLRSSITYRPGADSQGPYVDIGSNVAYAALVELGHGNTPHAYPKRGGGVGWVGSKRTRPFPYLRPALESARTT
jgi:phage gpG-like protein